MNPRFILIFYTKSINTKKDFLPFFLYLFEVGLFSIFVGVFIAILSHTSINSAKIDERKFNQSNNYIAIIN